MTKQSHIICNQYKLVSAPLEVLDFENLLQLDLSDNFIQVLTQAASFWKIGQHNFKKLPAEYEYLTATLFIDGNLLLCDCSLVNIFRSVSYVDSPNSPECVSQGLGSYTGYFKPFGYFISPKRTTSKILHFCSSKKWTCFDFMRPGNSKERVKLRHGLFMPLDLELTLF